MVNHRLAGMSLTPSKWPTAQCFLINNLLHEVSGPRKLIIQIPIDHCFSTQMNKITYNYLTPQHKIGFVFTNMFD